MKEERERNVRDIVDDILVHMTQLENEIAAISSQEKYKGRILRIHREIESIHDLLLEIRRRVHRVCGPDC